MRLTRRIWAALLPVSLLTACATTPQSTDSNPPATSAPIVQVSAAPSTPPPIETAAPPSRAPTSAPPVSAPQTAARPAKPATAALPSAPPLGAPLAPELRAFATDIARQHDLPADSVAALLEQARYSATAARLMTPTGTRVRRSWSTYRNRFVEPIRIRAGLAFWSEHAATLSRVSQEYGVPADIIVAIIGVETLYGRHTGNFRVLDALMTLGFHYPDGRRPERAAMFRDQLADLVVLHHQKRLDALTVTGSYAGAMGLPQFMPGSLMRHAADGDGDQRIDLFGSVPDAAASVARFLRNHGWVPGLPVFAPATLPADAGALVEGGLEPTWSWTALQARGARADTAASPWQQHKLGVIDLAEEARGTAEYRLGTPNFFALTHYNRSYFYATSVADLAAALSSGRAQGR